jgi:hypothetical protein
MTDFPDRLPWSSAPGALRERVARTVGAAVVDSAAVRGGMSPGPAAVLRLADGRRVFAKAVSAQVNPVSQRLFRWEAAALRTMPAAVPAPTLIGVAEADDWLAVVTSFVPGAIAGPPWTSPAVRAVSEACARTEVTPAPPGAPVAVNRLPDLDGWAKLAAEPDDLDDWEHRHIGRLAAVASGWRTWTAGDRLAHLDLRGDNALVDPRTGHAVLIDWSYGCAAAPGLDRALLAVDVLAAGHVDGRPTALREAAGLLAATPPEAVRFVVAHAGMLRRNSTLPTHPGMPAHRGWQRGRYLALRPLLTAILDGSHVNLAAGGLM